MKTATMDPRLRRVRDLLQQTMGPLPEVPNDSGMSDELLAAMVDHYGGDTLRTLVAFVHAWGQVKTALRKTEQQRDQLLNLVNALQTGPAVLAYVLTVPGEVRLNGVVRKQVTALPLARGGAVPQPFTVIQTEEPEEDLPEPPYLGLVNINAGAFLGPLQNGAGMPITADLRPAVAAREIEGSFTGEIEVLRDGSDQHCTLLAGLDLTREVARLLEEGEAVTVRDECGLATAVHKTEDIRDEWTEYIPLEGPQLSDLKYPPSFARELARDVDWICAGRALRILAIGPTGTGKTETVKRVAREAGKRMGKRVALVRVSAATMGTKWIHETARNFARAKRRAQTLARQGYVVVILVDECDALFGESDGLEHSHNREERLAFQELFSDDIPGVAVYLTMNARRNSWLPNAINRRFRKRVYRRTTRSLMASAAALFVTDAALTALGMSREEFGQVFADMLFAEDRVVGVAHLHSGRSITIRIRDLQVTSPGKAEAIITRFCEELEDRCATGLDDLQMMVAREFQAPELNASNLFEMTFITPPSHDSVRVVELMT